MLWFMIMKCELRSQEFWHSVNEMQLYEKQILMQIIDLMDLHMVPLNSIISMSLKVTQMIKHFIL